MTLPGLILITDWSVGREVLLERVAQALSGGHGAQVAVQHRHPDVTARQFADEAEALANVAAKTATPLFINRRLDVALALGAHLHLPTNAIRVADARAELPHAMISVAVHSDAEADRARGADLALISPVFSPGSKPTDTRRMLGVEAFANLAARVSCAPVALGGMTPERARWLPPETKIAVVSAVWTAADPAAAVRALLER